MNYISLDLEMNHDDDGRTREVIQVGYVIGNGDTGEILETRRLYVKNQHTRPLKPFIIELTGITDRDIQEHGVTMREIYGIISEDMRRYEVFMNPITWGGGDSLELREWINQEDPNIIPSGPFGYYVFGRRWIDVKTLYVVDRMAHGRKIQGGLKNACRKLGIKFDGPAHDATQDALNTYRVFMYYQERLKQ
jgi:inhibitor of KinA sporulation pathway (predicted exonuclease)